VKRLVTVTLAALLLAGCSPSSTPPVTDTPPAVAVSHPFQDALVGKGFSLKDMKITGDTAIVDPRDGSKCTVTIEANHPDAGTYRVTAVGGTPLSQLSPALRDMLKGDNITADDLWHAITVQRQVRQLHC